MLSSYDTGQGVFFVPGYRQLARNIKYQFSAIVQRKELAPTEHGDVSIRPERFTVNFILENMGAVFNEQEPSFITELSKVRNIARKSKVVNGQNDSGFGANLALDVVKIGLTIVVDPVELHLRA